MILATATLRGDGVGGTWTLDELIHHAESAAALKARPRK